MPRAKINPDTSAAKAYERMAKLDKAIEARVKAVEREAHELLQVHREFATRTDELLRAVLKERDAAILRATPTHTGEAS